MSPHRRVAALLPRCETRRQEFDCRWSDTAGCTHALLLSCALDARMSEARARATKRDSCGLGFRVVGWTSLDSPESVYPNQHTQPLALSNEIRGKIGLSPSRHIGRVDGGRESGSYMRTLMKGPARKKPCARPISVPRRVGDTPVRYAGRLDR